MNEPFRFQNIIDADGFGITITGMTIVFVALILISLFIAALPRVLQRLPDLSHHAHPAPRDAARDPARTARGDEALAAAIGFALHIRRQSNGDQPPSP